MSRAQWLSNLSNGIFSFFSRASFTIGIKIVDENAFSEVRFYLEIQPWKGTSIQLFSKKMVFGNNCWNPSSLEVLREDLMGRGHSDTGKAPTK